MPNITYESTSGRTLDLKGSVRLGRSLGMRGRKWSYEKTNNGLSSVTREAVECDMELLFSDAVSMAQAGELFDLDVANKAPAVLRIGEWWARVLIPESKAEMLNGRWYIQTARVILCDGVWRKGSTQRFDTTSSSAAYGLDYPFDYVMDYAPPSPAQTVNNLGMAQADIKIVIYGACSDPAITIGGNVYTVDINLQSNETLVIDTMAKTVEHIGRFGTVVNAFGLASRGDGSYIFKKIPSGESAISWDGSFVFDITVYREAGEPPWD